MFVSPIVFFRLNMALPISFQCLPTSKWVSDYTFREWLSRKCCPELDAGKRNMRRRKQQVIHLKRQAAQLGLQIIELLQRLPKTVSFSGEFFERYFDS